MVLHIVTRSPAKYFKIYCQFTMGCTNSTSKCVSPKREPNSEPTKPILTEDQKKLLLNTWKILQEDIAKVGVVMFIGVFENHPECKDTFLPFKELERDDLRWSTELKAHGLRVMGIVERVIARLYHDDKIDDLFKDLAAKHVKYGANSALVELFGPQFIRAVQPSLRDHWTDDIQNAWKTLFDLIIYYMTFHMDRIAQETKKQEKKRNSLKLRKYAVRNGQA
ncbi:uncharacterized protein LOC144452382 [Glandiceps talaboti]